MFNAEMVSCCMVRQFHVAYKDGFILCTKMVSLPSKYAYLKVMLKL